MTEPTSKSERFELSDTIERYVRFWNPGADDALTAEHAYVCECDGQAPQPNNF